MKQFGCIITGLLLIAIFLFGAVSLVAQEIIRGEVLDQVTQEPIIGAHVWIDEHEQGTITDHDGAFRIQTTHLPVLLTITYIGYDTAFQEASEAKRKLTIYLNEASVLIHGKVEITGSLISDRQRESPLNVVALERQAIKQLATLEAYDGSTILPGVDVATPSLGFTVVNTRGFTSTSPVRSLQIIDGVDNQSPGLNFSLGNFLGAPDLDILRIELIQGPSSAFYGPNAYNGVIDIRTRDPFLHQGLEASVKYGERNLIKGEFRYAQAFKNAAGKDKFAFKINGAYFSAQDWEATNYDPTFDSQDDITNPGGYDAVNVYGDEYYYDRDFSGPFGSSENPGLGRFYRTGYTESELLDYNTKNYKGNVGVYYKINKTTQVIGGLNFGGGTTVYQGENRFRLKDIFFWQAKAEIKKEGNFFLRAYLTQEDAGESYDAYATALILQSAPKSERFWSFDYAQYWRTFIRTRVTAETPVDSLFHWHALARAFADSKTFRGGAFYAPGTARFDSLFHLITERPLGDRSRPGSRFYDKSSLYHIQGEYQIHPTFGEITIGGNFRQYNPDSRGTIFSDTSGIKITNREFGIYAGLSKDIVGERLQFNLTTRLDKNQNFNPVLSPAASLVWTPKTDHVFRFSFSSALRNPTLTDQYLHLDVGRALLLGNISGYDSLITLDSFLDYLHKLNRDTLVYFNEPGIQPEKVRAIEFGYRGTYRNKLFVDASYYHSWYLDFIGYKIGVSTDFSSNLPVNTDIWRIAANAQTQVTTQGFSISAVYKLLNRFTLSGNYSWNVLNKKGTDDPIIPAYNTPEHKFNLGISGSDIQLPIGKRGLKPFGFGINYKWIEGYHFEGSPQFTGPIPTYDLLDAQINWHHERSGITIKVGATNVLNKKQYQVYGGPRVGRLAYISFLYEGRGRSDKIK